MKTKAWMPDPEIRRAAIKGLFAFAIIGLILVIFNMCKLIVNRIAGTRAEYRSSPCLPVEAPGAEGVGPPPLTFSRQSVPAIFTISSEHPDRDLLDAMLPEEGYKYDWVVGPAGERGPYQITEDYWKDACNYARLPWWTPEWDYETNVYDIDKCEFIIWLYWKRFLDYDLATDSEKARCHNGGPPDGQDLTAYDYAKRVMDRLARQAQMKGD